MNERERFEAKFPLAVWDIDACGYSEEMYTYALVGWKACAESKQTELDKANARIAQLDEALNIANDYLPLEGRSAEHNANVAMVHNAIYGSSDTWLSQHDKAVEVKVLEDVLLKMDDVSIHSRQSFKLVQNLIKARK